MRASKISITKTRTVDDKVSPEGIHGYVTVQKWSVLTGEWEIIDQFHPNLLTNGGRDFYHAQVLTNASAGTRGSGFLAVTADATAPAAGDTTLTTEITTNGLARADATTKTHSAGTNSSTIEHEWTATGTHTNVQKCALFNASSAGTMTHEGTFTAASLISGDKLKVTYVINVGRPILVNDKPWFRQQVKDLKNELAADNLTAVKARLETMLNTLIAPEEAADKQEVQHILNHLNSAIDQ